MQEFGAWVNNLDLSYKYALVLAVAIVLVFIAGFLKLWYITRWTRRMQLKEDMEKAKKTIEKAGAGKDLTAGDLFGVRAIEKGFYGGVSQVDLHAIPTRTMRPGGLSGTNSIIGSPNPTESVISLFNQSGPSVSRNTLRLQPSSAEIQRTRPQEIEVDMSATMPPSPTRRSFIETPIPTEPNRLTKPGRAYDPQPAQNRNSYKHSSPSTPIMGSTDSLMGNTSSHTTESLIQSRLSQSPLTRHPKPRQESLESTSTTQSLDSNHLDTNHPPHISPQPTQLPPLQKQTYKPQAQPQPHSHSPNGKKPMHIQPTVHKPSYPNYSDPERHYHNHPYYNPDPTIPQTTQGVRLRSGSIQGRPINFDTPRHSPFSDLNKTESVNSNHIRDTSISSSGASSNDSSSSSLDFADRETFRQVDGDGKKRNSRYPGMMALSQDDGGSQRR